MAIEYSEDAVKEELQIGVSQILGLNPPLRGIIRVEIPSSDGRDGAWISLDRIDVYEQGRSVYLKLALHVEIEIESIMTNLTDEQLTLKILELRRNITGETNPILVLKMDREVMETDFFLEDKTNNIKFEVEGLGITLQLGNPIGTRRFDNDDYAPSDLEKRPQIYFEFNRIKVQNLANPDIGDIVESMITQIEIVLPTLNNAVIKFRELFMN